MKEKISLLEQGRRRRRRRRVIVGKKRVYGQRTGAGQIEEA